MLYNHIFATHSLDMERAVQFGCTRSGDELTYRRALPQDGFYAVARLRDGQLEINVYEEPDGELYLPFNAAASDGTFVNSIRAAVEDLALELRDGCCVMTDIRLLVVDRMRMRYGVEPDRPFGEYDEYATLRTPSGKWFALFMRIPYASLGLDTKGMTDVLNLKARPEDIPQIIDGEHFFPAYHMNKKHWLTVLLTRDVEIDRVERLLCDSYDLVAGKKKGGA